MIEPGFCPEMDFETYLKAEALSKSGLVKLAQSAAHFKAPDKPRTSQQQSILNIGHGFHTLTLESQKLYDKLYDILPAGMTLTTKAGKDFKTKAEQTNKTILKHEDHINITNMAEAVHNHPDASKLVSGGVAEISCFWKDPVQGFMCKARADKITNNKVVVDLKSTGDAREDVFARIFVNKLYHWQAYWYLNGVSIASGVPHDDFAFVVVERDPPYGVNVFFADKELLAWSMEAIEPLKEKYAECLDKNEWPCYEAGPKYIELPRWAKPKTIYE